MMNKDRIKFENLFDIRYSPQNNDKGKALEDKVFEVFQKAVNELKNADDFRLLRNIVFKTSSYNNFEIDILLLYKESPLAIIEVKQSIDYFRRYCIERFGNYCGILNVQYCFACSVGLFELYKYDTILCPVSENTRLSTQTLLKTLKHQVIEHINTPDFNSINKDLIIAELTAVIEKSKIDNGIHTKLIEILTNTSYMSEGTESFYIDPKDEREFFIELLGQVPSKICRYTSLSSIFRTINEREQSMCSIVCMNDKSEIEYASGKINYEIIDRRRGANSCYILSCADISKKDDLTMWRLYGDDGQGVNIEYELDKQFISSYKSFALAPISYANEYGEDGRLDLIKALLTKRIDGFHIQFREWGIWQHFFKPYEYRDESEIRLLFWSGCDADEKEEHEKVDGFHPVFKRKWILESSYGVIAPIVCFKIIPDYEFFPFKIKQILIGPKNKEKEQNCQQIKALAEVKGICKESDINFTAVSSINHYR